MWDLLIASPVLTTGPTPSMRTELISSPNSLINKKKKEGPFLVEVYPAVRVHGSPFRGFLRPASNQWLLGSVTSVFRGRWGCGGSDSSLVHLALQSHFKKWTHYYGFPLCDFYFLHYHWGSRSSPWNNTCGSFYIQANPLMIGCTSQTGGLNGRHNTEQIKSIVGPL